MNLLSYILSHNWAMTTKARNEMLLIAMQEKDLQMDEKSAPVLTMQVFHDVSMNGQDSKDVEDFRDSIVVIPIRGSMIKRRNWWVTSTEEIAEMINDAVEHRVAGIILDIDSPGGATDSIGVLEEAILNAKANNVRIESYINEMADSAGYYVAALTDKITAATRMAEVGSIGVMASILDTRKMMADFGLKEINIVPPESADKNKNYFEALDGKTEGIITEQLTPWALHFQNIVQSNRPLVGPEVLTGKTFYAYDGVNKGLVDKIGSMQMLIQDMITNRDLNFLT